MDKRVVGTKDSAVSKKENRKRKAWPVYDPLAQRRKGLRSTMKIFQFFKLPIELRILIFRFVLVFPSGISPVFVHVPSKRRMVPILDIHGWDKPKLSWNLRPNPFLKTFLLSKLFHLEAHPIAYQNNAFKFFRLQLISDNPTAAYCFFSRESREAIRNVELTLDATNSLPNLFHILILICPPEYKIGREVLVRMFNMKVGNEQLGSLRNYLPSIEKLTVHVKMWGPLQPASSPLRLFPNPKEFMTIEKLIKNGVEPLTFDIVYQGNAPGSMPENELQMIIRTILRHHVEDKFQGLLRRVRERNRGAVGGDA